MSTKSTGLYSAPRLYTEDGEDGSYFICVSRKLKQYFQSFQIVGLTEHPLKSIVENLQVKGRITYGLWS